MVQSSPVKVCGNGHLPLGQSELGAQITRRIHLLQIPLRMHCPGKSGEVDLLLQRGGPTVKMDHHSVTAVKLTGILPGNVHLRISVK